MSKNNRMKCLEQYNSLIKAFADPCNGIIYHYTSAEGLRGIIENHEIWLTNVAFVNDKTDCRALQKEKNLFSASNFSNKNVNDKWKWFIRDNTRNSTYVASFSKCKKSLEQWRAYGDFRIAFKAEDLVMRPFNLYECVYHKKDIKKWILEKEKLKEWNGNCLTEPYKRGAALNMIYAASKKYKNKHFKGEKEVRLIVESHHIWDFPESPSMYEKDPPIYYRDHPTYKIPIPYVKFFIDGMKGQKGSKVRATYIEMKAKKLEDEKNKQRELLPITEILIGPKLHQKEAKIACEILLRDNGYEYAKVKVSRIPYRGF